MRHADYRRHSHNCREQTGVSRCHSHRIPKLGVVFPVQLAHVTVVVHRLMAPNAIEPRKPLRCCNRRRLALLPTSRAPDRVSRKTYTHPGMYRSSCCTSMALDDIRRQPRSFIHAIQVLYQNAGILLRQDSGGMGSPETLSGRKEKPTASDNPLPAPFWDRLVWTQLAVDLRCQPHFRHGDAVCGPLLRSSSRLTTTSGIT